MKGAVHDGFPSIGRQSTEPSNPMGQRYLETMWYHNNFIQHCAQKKLLQCQFGGVVRARVSVFHCLPQVRCGDCSKTRLASHPAADSPRLQARQKEGAQWFANQQGLTTFHTWRLSTSQQVFHDDLGPRTPEQWKNLVVLYIGDYTTRLRIIIRPYRDPEKILWSNKCNRM